MREFSGKSAVAAAVDELKSAGASAIGVVTDVTRFESLQALSPADQRVANFAKRLSALESTN